MQRNIRFFFDKLKENEKNITNDFIVSISEFIRA